MARTAKPVLISTDSPDRSHTISIVEADVSYMLKYKDRFFSMRRDHHYTDSKDYKKTSFTNLSLAYLMCDKFNALFKCNDFTVEIVTATQVAERTDTVQNNAKRREICKQRARNKTAARLATAIATNVVTLKVKK